MMTPTMARCQIGHRWIIQDKTRIRRGFVERLELLCASTCASSDPLFLKDWRLNNHWDGLYE